MASTPTTKSQVQAYKFVIRRMESALARKDAVMLHDPLGSHKRATIAGAIIACVGMIGFLVWGLFGGQGSVPKPGSVVIAKESGSVYVVTKDDRAKKRLIPMLNMASAKLLVMAKSGDYRGQRIKTTTVQQSALAQVPRGPMTGMPNAPGFLPSADKTIASKWAICDVGDVNTRLNDAQAQSSTEVTTTVLGGSSKPGPELGPKQGLYVQDQSSENKYLVYRVQMENRPGTRTVKARVRESEEAVMEMYGLKSAIPRTISTNMLNAIPSVAPLDVPTLPTGTADYMNSGDYQLGNVVRRTVPGSDDEYFVLANGGKQRISRGAAAVLHAARNTSKEIPNATGRLTDVPDVSAAEGLNVGHFPLAVPQPVSFQESSTSCLSWSAEEDKRRITVTLNDGSPTDHSPVKLAQFDDSGPRVDFFYMPPGKAAVVHSTTTANGGDSGTISLVSDRGVVYPVKDVATAKGLGVINGSGDIKMAPPAVLTALPAGAMLDPSRASRVYDSVPVEKGSGVNRPPKKENAQAAGAASAGS
ncbi:type VII secretion protein EccB [Saccharopolyspora lacisalsi]|uniref:Type VII secretion protein EccB n=2 Tax=Halosaccharopolyspora lacisalsi TaxID=1000566 RepID=A0A839E281_9PSEU|nr:type VII secretion protein EccB [Halosaccharopolyspora lacisalsi]